MAILIDTYNVLHCTHILSARYALMSVAQLCDLLACSRWRSERMVVVCDGARPPLAPHSDELTDVELIYAGGGKDADSLIEQLIEEETDPRHLTVVSNDRRLMTAARHGRARPMSSEDFLRDLVRRPKPGAPGKPQAGGDTQAWLREFGVEEETSLPPVGTDDTPAVPAEPDISSPPHREPRRSDESEADYWLREFGIEEDPFDDSSR